MLNPCQQCLLTSALTVSSQGESKAGYDTYTVYSLIMDSLAVEHNVLNTGSLFDTSLHYLPYILYIAQP